MGATPPLRISIKCSRKTEADDPYAFAFSPQDYLLEGPNASRATKHFEWSREFLEYLLEIRRPGAHAAIVERVGEKLRNFLAPLGWGAIEKKILEAADADRLIILTIRSSAAEINVLPWELLRMENTQHLCEVPKLLLRYEWPKFRSRFAPSQAPKGRVVVAWSAAGGSVPADEHVNAIESACKRRGLPFSREHDVVASASAQAIATTLTEGGPVRVLHLLCHGGVDESAFGLVLDGNTESESRVTLAPGQLRLLLADHLGTLQTVVLAACDFGNMGNLGNLTGSVAQTLHRAGLRTVIASRFPLSVAGSTEIARELYSQLFDAGVSLEVGLTRARARLRMNPTCLDWASLQYYAREDDGDETRPVALPRRWWLLFLVAAASAAVAAIITIARAVTPGPSSQPESQSPANGASSTSTATATATRSSIQLTREPTSLTTSGPTDATVTRSPPITTQPDLPNIVPAPVTTNLGCPPNMILIPGGKFKMGSSDGDGDGDEDERPQREVTLDPYCIDRTEVTAGAYQSCVDKGKCRTLPTKVNFSVTSKSDIDLWSNYCVGQKPDLKDHPVNCVNWEMASQYCKFRGSRLPTEAEWEYAARGPQAYTYPWGHADPNPTLLNGAGKETLEMLQNDGLLGKNKNDTMYNEYDGFPATAPVGHFPKGKSPFGVMDMAGNVWEWTADWYDSSYPDHPEENPRGPQRERGNRVFRGGGWNHTFIEWVRGANRGNAIPEHVDHDVGFRCASSPSSQ